MIGKYAFGTGFIVIGGEYHAKQRVFVVFRRADAGHIKRTPPPPHECIMTIRQLMQECVIATHTVKADNYQSSFFRFFSSLSS